jgi:hypothetical protein
MPSWEAQIKVVFRDMSRIQKKTEVAHTHKYRDNDNWEQSASRVFAVPMKITDERTMVETNDVLTSELDLGVPAIGPRHPDSGNSPPIQLVIR